MPDDTQAPADRGVWTAVWRGAIVLSLMGIAFQGGLIRANYDERINSLEAYVTRHTSEVSPVVARINALEAHLSAVDSQFKDLDTSRIRLAVELQAVVARIDVIATRQATVMAQIEARTESIGRMERTLDRIDASLRIHTDGGRRPE